MEPATRRLMLFAVGVGSVLVVLIGASAIVGHRSKEVPVVTADTRPLRERPADPGGLKVGGADNELFSSGSDTSNVRLAPPAETPDLRALHPMTASPVPAPSAGQSVSPGAALGQLPGAALGQLPGAALGQSPAQALASAPSPSAETSAMPAVAPTSRSLPAPSATGSKQAAVAPAAGNTVSLAVKPTQAKPAAAVPEAHPATTGHQPVVQLAAVTSEEGARQEWEQLTKRMPDLLKGRQPNYSRTERDGRTFWRIRTTGFADIAQARSFCEHVHAKGGGCSVADF